MQYLSSEKHCCQICMKQEEVPVALWLASLIWDVQVIQYSHAFI